MRIKWKESTYDVLEKKDDDQKLKIQLSDGTLKWLDISDVDYIEIECNQCDEEKFVENGTWALDAGMCETCYCAYQGG